MDGDVGMSSRANAAPPRIYSPPSLYWYVLANVAMLGLGVG